MMGSALSSRTDGNLLKEAAIRGGAESGASASRF